MEKDHPSNPGIFSIKGLTRLLPLSLPKRIYRFSVHIPPIRMLANALIRSRIPNSLKIEEGEILLDKSDVAVSGSLALGIFEKEEVDLFRKSLRPGMTVIDIGANIGLYTIIAAKRVGPTGKVFSFEPAQEICLRLKKNIEHNQFKNVTVNQVALDNTPGARTLYLDKDNKGHNSFSNDNSAYKELTVTTETLDQSLQKYDSPVVDIIKMDIEGAEPLAFEGMQETLKRSPNVVIFTEIFPDAIKRLGKDPLVFLNNLSNLNKSIWIINEDTTDLKLLKKKDFESFLKSLGKDDFANLCVSH